MLIVLLSIDILGIYLGLILSNTILGPGLLLETFERHEAYGQIRQLMFRMVKESLPNGQDSIPYLEKAVSEGWLEQEISMLLKNYYAFARGEKRETPIIYFSKLKKQVVDALDGSITHLDHQIGRFLQALHDENVLNNTVILFTSDHGDMMGDHDWFRKSLPYEGSASIPFIIYDPGNNLPGLKTGTTVNSIVELRDIMPTLLDAAGIEIPDTIDGKSVLPLAMGQEAEWREYLHGEHTFGTASNQYIVTERDKYIWYSQTGQEQYFDLEKDPQELHDAIDDAEYRDRIEYLRRILVNELKDREEGYSDGTRLIAGRPFRSSLSHIKD